MIALLCVAKLKMLSPESKIFLWIKPKKKLFCGKFGSMPTFRRTRKGKKCFLWWAYVCLTTRCYTTSHLHQFFVRFRSDFLPFFARISYFKFWSLRNLIKQLLHSRFLDMRLVIANSALHTLFTISYPTRAHGIIVKYSPKARWILSNNSRDEVEGIIRQYSPNLRRIIVLV